MTSFQRLLVVCPQMIVERNDDEKEESLPSSSPGDPIDKLTVKKLKEILEREDLKVSGNKEELRNRLKSHVQTMINQKTEDSDWR